jgi:transcriptional regulator with XRE-family HTH domain
VPGQSRAERAATALRLRTEGEGLSLAAIAREMGISISYASSLINDPTGEAERQRKARYKNLCEQCGEPCYGKRCVNCITWSPEDILDAIEVWGLRYGRAPYLREWAYAAEDHPSSGVVQRAFGSWNKAVEAAGLRPRPPGFPDWTLSEHHPAHGEARRRNQDALRAASERGRQRSGWKRD